jgi:hypothetical protein
MDKKEFFEWLETCPTHKWEVNDEFGDGLAQGISSCPFQRKKKTRRMNHASNQHTTYSRAAAI